MLKASRPTANAVLQCPTILSFSVCYCPKDYCDNDIQLRGMRYANSVWCYLSNLWNVHPRFAIPQTGNMHDFKPQSCKPTCRPKDPPGLRYWDPSPVIRHDNKHMSRGHKGPRSSEARCSASKAMLGMQLPNSTYQRCVRATFPGGDAAAGNAVQALTPKPQLSGQ